MSVYAWVAFGFVVWVALVCLIVLWFQGATPEPPQPPAPWDPDRWGP